MKQLNIAKLIEKTNVNTVTIHVHAIGRLTAAELRGRTTTGVSGKTRLHLVFCKLWIAGYCNRLKSDIESGQVIQGWHEMVRRIKWLRPLNCKAEWSSMIRFNNVETQQPF